MIKKILIIMMACFSGLVIQVSNVEASSLDNGSEDEAVSSVTEGQYEINVSNLNRVTPEQLFSKISSKDTFYVYFGYKECPYCRSFSPILKQSKLDSSINIQYFDIDQELKPELVNKLMSYFQNDLEMTGTPTIAYYKNGILSGKLSGADTTLQDIKSLSIMK